MDANPVLQDKGTALQLSVILVLFLAFIWWMEENVRPYLKFVIFMQTHWRFQSLVFMIMQRMDVFVWYVDQAPIAFEDFC